MRLVLLLVCILVGLVIGILGSRLTGSSAWYAAIPAVVAAGWLFVANPTECEPPRQVANNEKMHDAHSYGQSAACISDEPCQGDRIHALAPMSKNDSVMAFVYEGSSEKTLAAVESVLGELERNFDFPEDQFLYARANVLLILQPVQDNFLGVWLRGDNHWSSDVELARFLFQTTGKPVRCDPGQTFPDVSPYSDIFLEISESGETLVEWG